MDGDKLLGPELAPFPEIRMSKTCPAQSWKLGSVHGRRWNWRESNRMVVGGTAIRVLQTSLTDTL